MIMEKSEIAEKEEEILKFWQENKIFEKSVEKPAGKEPVGNFVFYDGPPFATGFCHISVIYCRPRLKMLSRVIKRCGASAWRVVGAGIVTGCRLKI